jgi:hypothetical protein
LINGGTGKCWKMSRPHYRKRRHCPLPTDQKYDPVKAYAAHRQFLLKHFPDAESSRLDVNIALDMREKGFKRENVLEALIHSVHRRRSRSNKYGTGGVMRNGLQPMLSA